MTLAFAGEIDEVDITRRLQKIEQELDNMNGGEWAFSFGDYSDIVSLVKTALERADFYIIEHISDWGFYWCGCLTAEPWGDLHAGEEWILNLLVKHHMVVRRDDKGVFLGFKNPTKSPLYRFFLKHRDGYGGNVAAGIGSMMYHLVEWMVKCWNSDLDRYGTWFPCGYCTKCECGFYTDEGVCPECGSHLTYEE